MLFVAGLAFSALTECTAYDRLPEPLALLRPVERHERHVHTSTGDPVEIKGELYLTALPLGART